MTQPEALRLAVALELRGFLGTTAHDAAAELRRLHADLERCKQLCAATAEGWRVEREELLEALKKPLAEWQISDLMADIDPEDVCSWSFRQGVYAAEKHHGVRP